MPLLRLRKNCIGERMLGIPLDRGGEAKQRLFAPLQRDDIRYLRFALGKRACLVQGNDVQLFRAFKHFSVSDEYAQFRAPPHTHRHGGRRRQPEGAGARDHEDRDQGGEGKEEGVSKNEIPQTKGKEGDCKHDRDEIGDDLIRYPLHGWLRTLGLFDEPNDLGEHGISAHLCCGEGEDTVLVESFPPRPYRPSSSVRE